MNDNIRYWSQKQQKNNMKCERITTNLKSVIYTKEMLICNLCYNELMHKYALNE